MIIVTGAVTAKPETFERLREVCIAHSIRSRAEDGCISHNVHVDCEDPMRLFFFERWAGREALNAHFKTPGTATLISELRALDAASGRPEIYETSSLAS